MRRQPGRPERSGWTGGARLACRGVRAARLRPWCWRASQRLARLPAGLLFPLRFAPRSSSLLSPTHPSAPCRPSQVGADLHFAGPANQRRGRADTISKVVFQHLARTQPITLVALQEAAAARCAGGGGGGALAGDGLGSGDSMAAEVASGRLCSGMSGSMCSELEGTAGASMALDAAETTDGIEMDS